MENLIKQYAEAVKAGDNETALVIAEEIRNLENEAKESEECAMGKEKVAENNKTKDKIREELETLGVKLTNTKFNKTKREELLVMLEEEKAKNVATHQVVVTDHAYYDEKHVALKGTHEQCEEYIVADSITEGGDACLASYEIQPVPVGDLEITHDNAPANDVTAEAPKAPVDNSDAKAKTDKLFALLKYRASQNEKNGYGYTISSFMLQAVILEAGAGVKQYKGHTVTEEEAKMSHDVYTWLKSKGFIKPCVYSVKEDDKVRIYTKEYTGRKDSPKTKLIPFEKSAGYTAKQVTSFVVTVK